MTKPRRGVAQRVAAFLPETLLAVPERVLLNVACALIGVSALIPPSGSVVAEWPTWQGWAWSATMIMGALFSLHGTFTGDRVSERVGALALCLASWFFAASALNQRGTAATIVALIFFFLGLAKLLRLIRSTAFTEVARQGGFSDTGTGDGGPPA